MEVVGGAFLSAALNVFFDRMTPNFRDLFRGRKGDEQILKKLKRTLTVIEAVLDDAEDKQTTNTPVSKWLSQLKGTVYDAEDLVDEINTEALRLQVEAGGELGVTHTVSPLPDKFLNEIIPKIEDVVSDLKDFESQVDVLGLKRRRVMKQGTPSRLPSTSLVDESEVYGRDSEREKLVHMLLNDSNGNGNNFCVIPIVGMGGLGKTTLAQLVYNDERVEKQFDRREWVCVSENYDAFKITQTLVERVVGGGFGEKDDLDLLQIQLKESLKDKKFLIVLDDVWNGNYNDWDKLKAPLKGGRQGSVILVTTRDEDVARMMQTRDICYIDSIPDEDCWSLLKMHAFGNRHALAPPEFERIGKEIVKKCKGLPLAVKTIGGLLWSKTNVKEWNDILRSDFWSSDDKPNDILPVLRLSYHYLPPYLKHCFAFCALFPKNYTFDEEELVLLWMANDLLQQPNRDEKVVECMEDVGHKYFNQLRSRSFFQKKSEGGYLMHDLINDLARYVSGNFCVRFEEDHQAREISREVRHVSYGPYLGRHFSYEPYLGRHVSYRPYSDVFENFKLLAQTNRLRTFFPIRPGMNCLRPQSFYRPHMNEMFLSDILPRLRHLNVLSLCGGNIKELPNSLGNLKHLRFLNLSGASIKQLPAAVCGLLNLQTLLLSGCGYLEKLPKDITKLVNLHHLGLVDTDLRKMPSHMGKLRSLQTLSYFVVDNSPGKRIEELGKLSLRGYLKINGLEKVTSCNEALKANLKNKNHLEELILQWNGSTNDSQIDRDILDKLQPDVNLRNLIVLGYGGTRFPDWLGDYSFGKIVSLNLKDCMNCVILPTLGYLSSLKSLVIGGLCNVIRIGEEFYGDGSLVKPFKSLETLDIWGMSELVEWDIPPYVDFYCLEELCISGCPKLKGKLPPRLLSIRYFKIDGCQHLLCLNDWMGVFQDKQMGSLSRPFSFLQHLSISNLPNLKELPEWVLRSRLKYLEINQCDNLVSFPKVTAIIDKITLTNCSSLVSLPIMVSSISITNCPKLEFPKDENSDGLYSMVEHSRVGTASLINNVTDLFGKLKDLCLKTCESLEVFPSLQNPTLLRNLEISNCNNLLHFPQGGLSAPNLEALWITRCEKLKSLPEKMHFLLPSLNTLVIQDCPEIESFPEGGLPSSIKGLCISLCEKFTRNPRDWGLQRLSALAFFEISQNNEVSFPDERLLPSSLRTLRINNDNNLKTLNEKGLLCLTSLETLEIKNCPNLQSLLEKGLPTSLKCLTFANCPKLQLLEEESLPFS